jgi:hypothetical protein
MAWPVAARCWGTAAPMRRIQARCRSANVIPCRGCTVASAPGLVETPSQSHRRIAAMDAIAAAPPGPSRIDQSRSNQDEDNDLGHDRLRPQDTDRRSRLMPAAFHRMTANASCMAWLPKTRAAMSTMRRNTTIPMSSLMALKEDVQGRRRFCYQALATAWCLLPRPEAGPLHPCDRCERCPADHLDSDQRSEHEGNRCRERESRSQPYSKLKFTWRGREVQRSRDFESAGNLT